MSKKWQNAIVIVSLAVFFALILWLTLFSRIGTGSRRFYPPLWSYRAILNGSVETLIEDVENIILFIPIGVAVGLFLGLQIRTALLVGFTLSLIIESCQWFFWLGVFEVDDLFHNTIGAGLGVALLDKFGFGRLLKPDNRKNSFALLIVLTLVVVSFGFAFKGLRWQERKRLATLNNREDGVINLLVLNGEAGYVGDSRVFVSYRDDGGIHVTGTSDSIGYLLIGNPTLGSGSYTLTGLSGQEPNTVGIYLEKKIDGSYLRFTPDLGPVDIVSFVLDKTENVRAYIKTYPGTEVDFTAYPVIYKEE